MKITLFRDRQKVREIIGLKSIYVDDIYFDFVKYDGTEIVDGIATDLYDTYLIEEET
jgi:hypothetical protein